MLPAEVLHQVRRLHLRARRLVQTLMGGEYHSAFKGVGLSFEEVREYQPGDDVRSIDWNVTARVGHPFIKRFVEERELTLLLVVDLSASQTFGSGLLTKRAVTAELAALLSLCAVSNNDRVGLIGFSDVVERFVAPNKGPRHVLRLLRDVLAFEPAHTGTDLAAALDYVTKVRSRRAIVFVISDFFGRGYERALQRAARKHDLICIRTTDPREREWPSTGLVRLQDAETGEQVLVDSADRRTRQSFARLAAERSGFSKLAQGCKAEVIEVGTDGGHFDALLGFFRKRDRQRRRG